MPSKKNVGRALRMARRKAGMSQDDFAVISSRTFVSSIERGLKSPTIEKLSELSAAMKMEAAVVVLVATVLDARNPAAKMAEICTFANQVLASGNEPAR